MRSFEKKRRARFDRKAIRNWKRRLGHHQRRWFEANGHMPMSFGALRGYVEADRIQFAPPMLSKDIDEPHRYFDERYGV